MKVKDMITDTDIAVDIRFGLPNPKYIEYVSRTLWAGLDIQSVAPFVQDIPKHKMDYAYVQRNHFEKKRLPKFSIIVSKNGGGKSTFARWQSWKFSKDTLCIELPINKLVALIAKREGNVHHIRENIFSGFAPELHKRLRETLLRCAPFDRYEELRAIFVDERISAWRDQLPRTPDVSSQVNEIISLLYEQYNAKQENALMLLLHVLKEYKSTEDICYQKLDGLADELSTLHPDAIAHEGKTEQNSSKGKGGLLTPELLITYIFNIYWERIFCDTYNRTRFVSALRKNKTWMQKLRWFYHYYPPVDHPQIPEEFELMAWLTCCEPDKLFDTSTVSRSLLEKFVHFMTESVTNLSGAPVEKPYTHIQIFIDGTDRIDYFSLLSLMQDLEALYDLSIDNLSLSLLLDKTLEDVIWDMDCVQKGYFAVCPLRPWNHQSLRRLLAKRLTAWRTNEHFENEKEVETWNWAQLIPDKDLHPVAKLHLIDKIVNGALEIGEKHVMDAPLHALKLARGLVAACGGVWPQYHPVTMQAVNTIIELYRQSVLEEKNEN